MKDNERIEILEDLLLQYIYMYKQSKELYHFSVYEYDFDKKTTFKIKYNKDLLDYLLDVEFDLYEQEEDIIFKIKNKLKLFKNELNELKNKKKLNNKKKININNNDKKTYLIKDKQTNFYKIGFSKNPEKREKTLQSEKPNIKIVKIWNKNIEKKLHLKYKEFRIRGEWFNLTPIQVKYICTNY